MKFRNSIFSLVLATAASAAASEVALADDARFNQFSDRSPVYDSARPYQRQPSVGTTAPTVARTHGFNDRTSHVGDSARPYQQRPPAVQDRVVTRATLFNRFSERTTVIRDSQRPYQYAPNTAQR